MASHYRVTKRPNYSYEYLQKILTANAYMSNKKNQ